MEDHTYTFFKNEDMELKIQEAEGFAFMHMEVGNWGKSQLRELRRVREDLRSHLRSEGYEWVFATSDTKKSTKFWNLMEPCHTINKFGPNDEYYIGAWKL